MIVLDRSTPMPPHQQAAVGALIDALTHLRVAVSLVGGEDLTAIYARTAILAGAERIERLAEQIGSLDLPDSTRR